LIDKNIEIFKENFISVKDKSRKGNNHYTHSPSELKENPYSHVVHLSLDEHSEQFGILLQVRHVLVAV
jgi:hypothetical protein